MGARNDRELEPDRHMERRRTEDMSDTELLVMAMAGKLYPSGRL